MRKWLSVLLTAGFLISSSSWALEPEKPVLTLYINQEDIPPFMRDWVIHSGETIAENLPEYSVKRVWTDPLSLKAGIEKGEVSLFIASSGFFRRLGFSGVRDLAGSMQETDGDPTGLSGRCLL